MLLSSGAFPVPTLPLAPPGSAIYQTQVASDFAATAQTDAHTIDLDAGQHLTALFEPQDPSILAELRMLDPSGNVLGTATAGGAGQAILLQNVVAASDGTYALEATSQAGDGNYRLELLLNAALEVEAHAGPANDTLLDAQDIDSSFLDLGVRRGAVVGTLPIGPDRTVDLDNFESGRLNRQWTTASSDPGGRILVTSVFGAASGSWALTMDRFPDGVHNLNEATWKVDLSGLSNAKLSFFHADFNDEEETMPPVFQGSANGDGVSISSDGTTWHTVMTAPDQVDESWVSHTIDLDGAASAAGIRLGKDFRIKFQQYDNLPLTTDGRGYDRVEITTPVTTED